MTAPRTRVTTVLVAILVITGGGSLVVSATTETGADAVESGTNGDAVVVQDETETTTVGTETTTQFVNLDSPDITFQNQTSNGTVVNVNQVVLPDGGFVAIHLARNVTGNFTTTATADMLGQRIGNSTYLERGLTENVTIRLDQTLTESQMLIAVPHRDTNDNQQFDPALERVETTPAEEGTETVTTPAMEGQETTTPAAEQVDAPYTQTPGDQPILATAFVNVEEGAVAGETTVANETTTEVA